MQNNNRIGRFTSSEIYRLCSFDKSGKNPGDQFYSYIEEVNGEIALGRSIETESTDRALIWGKVCEQFVFENMLGLEYEKTSEETVIHPEIDCWAGTKDCLKVDLPKRIVCDVKCPYTLTSAYKLLRFADMDGESYWNILRNGTKQSNGLRFKKYDQAEKYYLQLVSNAILNGCTHIELIVFVPTQKQLTEIRSIAQDTFGGYFLGYALDIELPYLPEQGCKYDPLTKIEFEVPQSDKDFLTERVLMASKMLLQK